MINNQIEEAIRKYEYTREEIYKEFEIAFIQQRIKNKLLKKEDKSVEVLFYNRNEMNEEEMNFENLLSEEAECNNNQIGSNESEMESKGSEMESNESEMDDNKKSIQRHHKNKLSSFLDLQADYSGSSENEDEFDEDLSEIIDNTENNLDSDINLEQFAKDKIEMDEKILKNLKQKFASKKYKNQSKIDLIQNEIESNEDFPEIKQFEIEEESVERIEVVKNENLGISNFNKKIKLDDEIFEDEKYAIEKIDRKEEKKNVGFISK